MCCPDQTSRNRLIPAAKPEAATRHAGRKCKRTLTLAVYDPAAAEKRAAAASLLPLSARAGALVPFLEQPPVLATAPRAEPPWLRERLKLRVDLTVHFIGEKAVTITDLDAQQNRFRLPTEDVLRSLRPILTAEELRAANIPRFGALEAPRARTPPKPKLLPPPGTEEELQQQQENTKIVKRTKKTGRKHGGLPVNLCNVDAGEAKKLKMTRWESSRAVVIKGEGYQDFITRCGFKQNDVVEIWAFKERGFYYFGAWFLPERPLCVVLAKKEQRC